jgi:hypothetical protein
MTARKKFGRPVVFEAEDDTPGGAVRSIRMTREGGALEGAYATISSQDDMRLAPYAAHRREIISSSVKAWISLILFWISLAFIVSTFVM